MPGKSALTAITALLMAASLSPARAWERDVTVSGPKGESSISVDGRCSDGACSRSVTAMGPNGATVTRISPQIRFGAGNVARSCSDGSCTREITRKGRYGRSVTRAVARSVAR